MWELSLVSGQRLKFGSLHLQHHKFKLNFFVFCLEQLLCLNYFHYFCICFLFSAFNLRFQHFVFFASPFAPSLFFKLIH